MTFGRSRISHPRRVSPARPGLLARSRSSPNAFADFYEEMSPGVLRFFTRQTHDGQAAFDLLAETFCKAFEKRQDFRGTNDKQAAAWLWTIARNELARFHRSRSVEMSALQRLGLERPAPTDEELREVERLIAHEDIRRRITVALDSLSPDQQEVIKLRFIDELSDQEIAERLAVSHDVVRARASRALRALGASEHLQATMEMWDQ
jgi:RNA polymerase sigma-70 factor (ECF subfamily)